MLLQIRALAYPSLRPAMCSSIIGVIFIAGGVFLLVICHVYNLKMFIPGLAVTLFGSFLCIASVINLMIKRKHIIASGLKNRCNSSEHESSKPNKRNFIDPKVSRAIFNIHFRSCDETWIGNCKQNLGSKFFESNRRKICFVAKRCNYEMVTSCNTQLNTNGSN